MLTYGFYNSKDHDRLYDAIQISSIFDGIIRDGVFMSIGSHLQVTANNRMTITVGTGRTWFDHSWTLNDSPLLLMIPPSEIIMKRIDAIVLEVNGNTRINDIKVVKGTPSTTNPQRPVMVNTENVHQYPLAFINVGENVTEIRQANITNMVGTSSTPFVTGILETINIDSLVAQWGAQWTDWSAGVVKEYTEWTKELHDILDGEVASNLAVRILGLEKESTGQNTEIVQINQDIQNIQNTALTQNQAIVNHETRLGDVETTQTYQGLLITNHGNTLSTHSTQINNLETSVSGLTTALNALDNSVVKSTNIRNIVFVSSLPADAASHPDTLYLIPE